MKPGRTMIVFSLAGALAGVLAACGGPKILAGDSDTVSITGAPWDDVAAAAAEYCRGYGKTAEPLGDRPLGPETTERLYDYNCVTPGGSGD